MRLTLVQPPNGLHDRFELAPPVGLLSIAAVVEDDGVDVTLVDLNLRGMRNPAWLSGDVYPRAVQAIAATNPDVVGFTSMALESHVCLELARRIKQADPQVVTVLGGPHFTAIARETLELYPWIDYVVAGEGEVALRSLLRYLRGRAGAEDLVNVARRDGAGMALRRVLKSMASLAELPFPAYHLVDLNAYFAANPQRVLDYEHGRGCIFRCSFCYSPVQWGQGGQSKAIDRVVDEVARLAALGARHLFFVQDNFLNATAPAVALCRALTDARLPITWNCYGTLPQLTPEVLDALAAAGCIDVFTGVDAVSAAAQRAFAKHFFKGWGPLEGRLRAALNRGVGVTCAFMIDPPLAGHVDTDAALTTALFARALGCGARLNTLTLYNNTPSEIAMRAQPLTYTAIKPQLLLDTPEIIHDNPYARAHPELFPFHNTALPLPLYERFCAGTHIAHELFSSFRRTLVQYVLVDGGSLWTLLDRLVDETGDLSQVHPLQRDRLERDVFIRAVERRPLSRQTRAAFELERAELSLSADGAAGTATATTRAAGPAQHYRAGRFRVVDLPHAPEAFRPVAPLPEATGAPDPYAVVRVGGHVEYRALSADLAAAARRLRAARWSGVPVELPEAVLAGLTTAGLIEPAGASPLPA